MLAVRKIPTARTVKKEEATRKLFFGVGECFMENIGKLNALYSR